MNPPKRVIVYRIGSLGDTLIALPAYRLIRDTFPGAHITLLTSFPINSKAAPMEQILQHSNLYDDTLRYPTSLRNFRELMQLRSDLIAGNYDCLIYLAKPKGGLWTSIRDYMFFRLCGVRRVIGVPFRQNQLECLPIAGEERYQSETLRTLSCLNKLGAVDLNDEHWWDLQLTQIERNEADRLLNEAGIRGPFLAASVGTKVQANDWEEHNWLQLFRRLAPFYSHLPVVMFGVADERERSQRMLDLWHGTTLNLCGVTSPRVSAAVLESAAAMVCHDSGPMHLAATMGVPCVAIFSARGKPGEWYPRGEENVIFYHKVPCWQCHLTVCIENRKACILSITVDEVFNAISGKLQQKGISSPARIALQSP